MQHIDADELALIALGEASADQSELDHLHECAECAQLLRELGLASSVGKSTVDMGALLSPAPRVWDSIAAELGIRARPSASLTPIRSRRATYRWAILAAAAVAVVALVIGSVVQLRSLNAAQTLATATLQAFPQWAGASGRAVVDELNNGTREVTVSMNVAPERATYHEVWLMSKDGSSLVSLGILRSEQATFTIPSNVDLKKYPLVDISDEKHDGNPAHSGNSIVRGALATSSGRVSLG